MKKQKYHAGGKAVKRKPPRRKPSTAGKIVLAVVTCINVALSLAVSLLNRAEVIHAVQEDEDIKVLFTAKGKLAKK